MMTVQVYYASSTLLFTLMKYFVPQFKLSIDMPPQTKPEDKVGGLPWGLPSERYPICCDCGKSQSLLIQLVHHPERLLGVYCLTQ